tara:strand:+ start:85 stop:315 length:231 start_codon:yes stop_codon:yes gene_type:complete
LVIASLKVINRPASNTQPIPLRISLKSELVLGCGDDMFSAPGSTEKGIGGKAFNRRLYLLCPFLDATGLVIPKYRN